MATETIDLGIHVGVTNSRAAVAHAASATVIPNLEGAHTTPTAVWLDDQERLIVGAPALARLRDDAGNVLTHFFRLLGTDELQRFARSPRAAEPVDLVAAVIRSLCVDAVRALGRPVEDAVLTAPANFKPAQRDALAAAARKADLKYSPLVQEPVAAALAYGGPADGAHWLVYDFGGVSFDAALVTLRNGAVRVVAHAHDTRLGGDLLDWEIVRKLFAPAVAAEARVTQFRRDNPRWQAAFDKLRAAAEEARWRLASEPSVEVRISFLCRDDDGAPVRFGYTFERADLEALLAPVAQRSLKVCERLLARRELAPDGLERVVLAGGPARDPFFADFLVGSGIAAGDRLAADLDPLTVVVRGAALYAGREEVFRVAPPVFQDGREVLPAPPPAPLRPPAPAPAAPPDMEVPSPGGAVEEPVAAEAPEAAEEPTVAEAPELAEEPTAEAPEVAEEATVAEVQEDVDEPAAEAADVETHEPHAGEAHVGAPASPPPQVTSSAATSPDEQVLEDHEAEELETSEPEVMEIVQPSVAEVPAHDDATPREEESPAAETPSGTAVAERAEPEAPPVEAPSAWRPTAPAPEGPAGDEDREPPPAPAPPPAEAVATRPEPPLPLGDKGALEQKILVWATSLALAGRFADAKRLLRRLGPVEELSPAALDLLVRIYTGEGRFDKAELVWRFAQCHGQIEGGSYDAREYALAKAPSAVVDDQPVAEPPNEPHGPGGAATDGDAEETVAAGEDAGPATDGDAEETVAAGEDAGQAADSPLDLDWRPSPPPGHVEAAPGTVAPETAAPADVTPDDGAPDDRAPATGRYVPRHPAIKPPSGDADAGTGASSDWADDLMDEGDDLGAGPGTSGSFLDEPLTPGSSSFRRMDAYQADEATPRRRTAPPLGDVDARPPRRVDKHDDRRWPPALVSGIVAVIVLAVVAVVLLVRACDSSASPPPRGAALVREAPSGWLTARVAAADRLAASGPRGVGPHWYSQPHRL